MVAAAAIGSAGLAVIKQHEGVRYKTYLDPVGIPTVCYGHTGPEVRLGQSYSAKQCEDLLIRDIIKHAGYVTPGNKLNCIKDAPLNPNQRDAVVSFVFNVGGTKFCRSTMAKALAARNYTAAANEFPKWVNAGGRPLPGLVKRRAAERRLFLSNHRSEANNTMSRSAVGILAAASQQN